MEKKRLNFWQIWNMSFGFLGIQFGFALQNANTSRIFQTLGASVDNIPILWIAAPTTGLIIQPIIGYMSDRTWGRLGRRRPYFLTGAILASLALLIMPNSPYLWVAAGMLWIMDASINVSMEPFRALVADLLPSEQRTMGFAIQSFFIGIGAVVASALPYIFDHWFHVSNVAAEGEIPASVKYSFYAGAAAFITAVVWTVVKTKEYPPKDLEAFRKEKSESAGIMAGVKDIFKSFVQIPKTMAQLAVVQFFTWFALFAMWIYTTPAVTKHIYHTVDTASAAYNEGANWVGVLFAAYNGFAAVCAFLLPLIAKHTSRKFVHMLSLVIGGLGLASFYVVGDPNILIISMLGIGLAWASILSMPYAILAGALPPEKMGVYMGIFNFFIVIPQILASAILGFFMKTFLQNEAIYALLLGGASMILAGIMVMFVKDVDEK
ncbi:MAG: MFS transporter [Bacteroidota bacterium]|nr:SLC45 family MFS transporter [Ignavibacteria bacterium]MCU7499040.1 SLC45 family MFS transporter [Ignavibacteria bacterium]MCU7512387.1 SLC45 family MFS transporter [Ignavibacteria bacterium]MCU7521739.1 SLC45 family MFS transporter [Ignavibacteria bacterium]MCU7524413.1 SLC45 family MFS transporter [Ignavibacteria bacterium]